MVNPIEAKIFLVPVEDVDQRMQDLADADTPATTFTHVSGPYVAIAVAVSKKSKPANPASGFPGEGE